MPWTRPTLKQLAERISGDFSGRLLDGGKVLPRSVIMVFAKVWAQACNVMHGVFVWAFKQVFADTAEKEYLVRQTANWGLTPKEASFAAGVVHLQGDEGAVLPSGYYLTRQATGLLYATQGDAVIIGGTATVTAIASQAGPAGNLAAGAALSLIAPVGGIRSVVRVGEGGITGGFEAETDEELRARYLERIRKPPRGGKAADYVAWAKEIQGVTRAWAYPLGKGIGTVTLCFVTDFAETGPIPTPEKVAEVQAHIDSVRPATVKDFEAYAPTELRVDFHLHVWPNTAAVREAVRAELGDYVAGAAKPDTTLLLSQMHEAISLTPGEEDHTLYVPSADIHVPPGVYPVLGTVSFV